MQTANTQGWQALEKVACDVIRQLPRTPDFIDSGEPVRQEDIKVGTYVAFWDGGHIIQGRVSSILRRGASQKPDLFKISWYPDAKRADELIIYRGDIL